MIELSKASKFLEKFSLLTVGESKVPNFLWAKNQKEKLSKEEFARQYNYAGGWKTKSGREIQPTTNFGIITGFEDLECVDVDLKVFGTAKEKTEFWNEYMKFLKDYIFDFDKKFSIYKTKNDGFHILYKTKRVEGNLKIAKLEGHKEAIIETRGKGGYVFAYPDNCHNKKTYFDIEYVSDEDREALIGLSRTYDFVDEKPVEPIKKKTVYVDGDITPWEDYNNKVSIFDVISGEFEIKHRLESAKKYVIKRHGATSVHSGYVFKDSMCMYLFSTGTIYPHQKLLSPFNAYAIKYHNADMKVASSVLYNEGYGSRIKKKIVDVDYEIIKPKININKEALQFPIDIFPIQIQSYITECGHTLNSSIDYMGCSLLWLLSVCIGNSLRVEIMPGWTENATIWMSIVGKAGWGKTPSIKRVIDSLQKLNARKVKRYYNELEKFEAYDSLSKKDKQEHEEIRKPIKEQFIANDITLEALVDLHHESDNAVGVFKDELAGWFKDMNKYRPGSDLEFWLSCWSGSPVILTRITRKGSFIGQPCIPVLGGIQPSVLTNFNTAENKENGFMDRMLLCYPDLKAQPLSKRRMKYESIKNFNESMIGFYETILSDVLDRNGDGEIEPRNAILTDDAYKLYDKRHLEITNVENDDQVSEYLKSMLPKQKAYIARFALLIHAADCYFKDSDDVLNISVESMEKAIRLSDYFIETAKKVKLSSTEVSEYKRIIDLNRTKNRKDQVKSIWVADPEFNQVEVAGIIDVSTRTIRRYIEDFEKSEK